MPGAQEYKIKVFGRVVGAMETYKQFPEASSKQSVYDFPKGDLQPGYTYEAVMSPVSPTSGRYYTEYSTRVARTRILFQIVPGDIENFRVTNSQFVPHQGTLKNLPALVR
jgi:hypothetical protein